MGRQLIAASAGDYSGGFGMAEISSIVDNFSMGFWFWSDSTDHIVRVYNGDDSSTGVGLQVNSTVGKINVLHGGISEFGGDTGYTPSVWNSIIYVRSSGTAQIYLNGSTLGASFANTPNTPNGTGSDPVFGPHLFYAPTSGKTSKMEEVFFYSRVLTSAEITAIGANRYSPLWFPVSLTRYIPLFGKDSPEPTGSLGTFGGSNTPAIARSGSAATPCDHPDIRYPALRTLYW